jgi:hypothetical protein
VEFRLWSTLHIWTERTDKMKGKIIQEMDYAPLVILAFNKLYFSFSEFFIKFLKYLYNFDSSPTSSIFSICLGYILSSIEKDES